MLGSHSVGDANDEEANDPEFNFLEALAKHPRGLQKYHEEAIRTVHDSWIDREGDAVLVDADEVAAYEREHPQEFKRGAYLGAYADIHGGPEEDRNGYIQQLAREGLTKLGHHGAVSAMGVARHAGMGCRGLGGVASATAFR